MNTRTLVTRSVIVFIALAVAGVAVAVSSQFAMSEFQQNVMIAIGSAIFGGALSFFLVRIFAVVEK